MRALLLLAALVVSCATAPARHDSFTGRTVDCSGCGRPAVNEVRACLLTPGYADCLEAALVGFSVDAVACEVRRQGGETNVLLLRGSATTDDRTVNTNARAWIEAEGMGYR